MRLLEYIKHVKPAYEPDWFQLAIIEELEKVATGEQSLLVSTPPGHGKTELISILFPSWLVEEDPNTHIISLANSDGLARLAAGNILRIVQSPAFQELCPTQLDKASEQQFQVKGNDGRPTLHSAGINGQLTGHRAKFLVGDDLIKSLADSYSETIRERVWSNFNSAAETRLLPDGQIVMIHTRWHLQDPIGQLLDRAKNPLSRQFVYLNFAGVNGGQDSFRLDTKTGEKQFFPPYKSLATKKGQPYSFGPKQLKGKEADLGPVVYSALYQGNPVSRQGQMFPPECWGRPIENLNIDDFTMIVTAWDTASRAKANNDPSANCVVGRRASGDFVVLDYQEFKLTFDRLFPVVMERDRQLAEQFKMIPLLAIEDKSSGQQLIDIIRSQFPNAPLVAAKAVHSKIVRAEGVTPFTTAKSVKLLKGDWNAGFIALMANFPAGADHATDSFVHAMKCFTGTGSDFKKPEWSLGDWKKDYEAVDEMEVACGTLMLGESVLRGPEDF